MSSRIFLNENAVAEGERYGLNLISKNPTLAVWLPLAYNTAEDEFQQPSGTVFEYDVNLNTVKKHTKFSKFIYDLAYYRELRNLPVRSLVNGVGSTDISAILFAVYAALLYIRVNDQN